MLIDAELVRDTRARRGWTQQQLAEIASLSLRTVQRIENQGVASNESVSALSAVLELPRETLLAPQPSRKVAVAERRLLILTTVAAVAGASVGTLVTLLVTGTLGG